jgi:hypothetical protein
MVGVLLYNVSMENNIPTPIPTPKIPTPASVEKLKKSKFIIWCAYIYIAIYVLQVIFQFIRMGMNFGPFGLMGLGFLSLIIPLLVLYTNNKTVYRYARILLVLKLAFTIFALVGAYIVFLSQI